MSKRDKFPTLLKLFNAFDCDSLVSPILFGIVNIYLVSFAYPVNVKDVSSTKWPLNFLLLLLTIILKNADDAIEKPCYQNKKMKRERERGKRGWRRRNHIHHANWESGPWIAKHNCISQFYNTDNVVYSIHAVCTTLFKDQNWVALFLLGIFFSFYLECQITVYSSRKKARENEW